jgi:hypothetical protein
MSLKSPILDFQILIFSYWIHVLGFLGGCLQQPPHSVQMTAEDIRP